MQLHDIQHTSTSSRAFPAHSRRRHPTQNHVNTHSRLPSSSDPLLFSSVLLPTSDNPTSRGRDLGCQHSSPPHIGQPLRFPPVVVAPGSSTDNRNSGMLLLSVPPYMVGGEVNGICGTHFCLASINRYFRSNNVCSDVFRLINVVANPVFPDLPVLPISCT
jgi:hypothetical protein